MIRRYGVLLLSLCVSAAGCQSTGPSSVQVSDRGVIRSEADGFRMDLEEARKKQDKARIYLLALRDIVDLGLNSGLNRRKPSSDEMLRILERLQGTGDPKVRDLFAKLADPTNQTAQNRAAQNRLGGELALALVDGALDSLK